MLTMFKVNNKNKRTMACCIYFKQEHMHITYFFIVNFEHVFFSCALKNRAISSKHVPVT